MTRNWGRGASGAANQLHIDVDRGRDSIDANDALDFGRSFCFAAAPR